MKAVVCLIACLLVLATSPRPSHASNGCPAPAEDMHELVYSHLQEEVTKQLPKLTEAAIRDVPRFTTRDKQDSAPSANASLATIVNSTGFSSLFSAAFDQVVGGQSSDDDGIFTLNASPFLFAVAYDQNAYYDQEIYEQQQYDLMRRIRRYRLVWRKGLGVRSRWRRDEGGCANVLIVQRHRHMGDTIPRFR
jgi:hypothetical protein